MALRTIHSISELERELDAADAASKNSHADYLNLLEGFVLDPKSVIGKLPPDPCSKAYLAATGSSYANPSLVVQVSHQSGNVSLIRDQK